MNYKGITFGAIIEAHGREVSPTQSTYLCRMRGGFSKY